MDIARQVPTPFGVAVEPHEGTTNAPVDEGAGKSLEGFPKTVTFSLWLPSQPQPTTARIRDVQLQSSRRLAI